MYLNHSIYVLSSVVNTSIAFELATLFEFDFQVSRQWNFIRFTLATNFLYLSEALDSQAARAAGR